jgi:succinyl-CoA synthetase beta subunit
MNIHEYQAKSLFSDYGIPTPVGSVASSPQEARKAAESSATERWVVKAQAHTGGRGKAGGVLLADSPAEVEKAAEKILGMTLVTRQTGPTGLPVNQVLVEEADEIAREIYLGLLLDRHHSRLSFIVSAAGGMDIEEVAKESPDRIITSLINPATGLLPYQCRDLAYGLGLEGAQIKQFTEILSGLYRLYTEKDASLIEINPLIVNRTGKLLALDAKISFDSNALYRHPDIVAMRDPSQEDEKEAMAAEHDLSYVTLDGTIGCMVNGAGLAMATADLVQLQGCAPANFLDVGGGVTTERVTEAFKLILTDANVCAILINIFGGIVRCDLIAEGIIDAAHSVDIDVPVVVRLEGTNRELGLQLLHDSDLHFITATNFKDAAQKAVAVSAA